MSKKTEKVIDAEFTTVDEGARERAVTLLEGKFPYHRERYLNEIEICLKRAENSFIEAGKMFLVMKEREAHGDFLAIIEERFPNYRYRTVNELMRVAVVLEEHPQIATKVSNLPKKTVLELCRAPEEDLQELEDKGVMAGYEMDEIARMTVREVRELARKLKKDKEKLIHEAVKEETEGYKSLIKDLKAENESLMRKLPESADSTRFLDEIEAMKTKISEFFDLVLKFSPTEELRDDLPTQGKIEAALRDMQSRLSMLDARWEAFQAQEEFGE